MVVFRTNASSSVGIGHLARCRRLANRLQEDGSDVSFVLDQVNSFASAYLNDFSVNELYCKDLCFDDEERDAILFIESLKNKNISCVVVDDYRLSHVWEKAVSILGKPIIALDDQNINKHQCDLLVDSTWQGEDTPKRYETLVGSDTIRLLGPKYLLIDEMFGSQAPKEKSCGDGASVKLLLNLGGGGDLSILVLIAQCLISNKPSDTTYFISIVAGPYAISQDKLTDFASRYDEVEVIFNQDGLFDHLIETDLYVGTSGGTLFEALSLKIPALTFSVSNNQANNIENFENLGHYFHIGSLDLDNI